MIQTWRDLWGQGDFSFYWVQLADFMNERSEPAESAWAELREAQTMTMRRLPHTGEAVIIDIGEGKDIHPRNKQDVAKRAAGAVGPGQGLWCRSSQPEPDLQIDGKAGQQDRAHVRSCGWRVSSLRRQRPARVHHRRLRPQVRPGPVQSRRSRQD